MSEQQQTCKWLTWDACKGMLAPRAEDAHKGSCGSVAVIGGADGMVGAALLAARAALYSGAGRVYVALLSNLAPVVDFNQPELMLRSPSDLHKHSQLDCVAIGPGLGLSISAVEQLLFWLKDTAIQHVPMVLDADALNLIAQHPHLADLLKQRATAAVITPHPGEAARLLATDVKTIQSGRVQAALKLAASLRVICVLKGHETVCASPDGSYFVNPTGNAGLATPGSGDVLTGIISSLIAQGVSTFEAAQLGVFVHGYAADVLVKKGIGPRGLVASEVLLEARSVINLLSES